MTIGDILKLAISIVLCQLAGFFGSLFTTPAIPTWYKTLKKPFFTPPNWMFSPVWITLFILMGISLFMVWRKQDHPRFKITLIFFLIQLILNILWSVAFFGLRSPLLGLIHIVLLWGAILFDDPTLSESLKDGSASPSALHYMGIWVSFAVGLNFFLWILNTSLDEDG